MARAQATNGTEKAAILLLSLGVMMPVVAQDLAIDAKLVGVFTAIIYGVATVAALAAKGVTVTGAAVDVSDGPILKAWVTEVAAELGGLDIIVANVSAMAVSDDEAGWSSGFSIDLMGTVRLVDAAMPFLLASKAAAIVTISSVSAREVDADTGPYGVFKAAIIHYTQGLAQKLAAQGVRANTVSPGTTWFEGGVWSRIRDDDPSAYQMALDLNPTGRMATPQEIANAAVFLASPAASFISGANLVVDGALTRGVHL